MGKTKIIAAVVLIAGLCYAAAPAGRQPTLREEVDDLKARVVALEKAVAAMKPVPPPANVAVFKVGMTVKEAEAAMANAGGKLLKAPDKDTFEARGKVYERVIWYVRVGEDRDFSVFIENGVVVRVVE